MLALATGLCLVLAVQQVRAPPLATTTNPNYIGPALGPVGESPYQGKDSVFHLGVCVKTCAYRVCVCVCACVCAGVR